MRNIDGTFAPGPDPDRHKRGGPNLEVKEAALRAAERNGCTSFLDALFDRAIKGDTPLSIALLARLYPKLTSIQVVLDVANLPTITPEFYKQLVRTVPGEPCEPKPAGDKDLGEK